MESSVETQDRESRAEKDTPLTAREAAAYLQISTNTLERLRRRGVIQGIEVRWRRWHFSPAALHAYQQAQQKAANPASENSDSSTLWDILREGGIEPKPETVPAPITPITQAEQTPVVRTVNKLLADACEAGASDLHLERMPQSLRVRQRVDGVLIEVGRLPVHTADPLMARLMVMAGIPATTSKPAAVPQLGHIPIVHRNQKRDLRVSVLPFLQSITLRMGDSAPRSFDEMGLTAPQQAVLKTLLAHRPALLLVGGGIGAGTTSTLHAIAASLNHSDTKIVVLQKGQLEWSMEGVIQTPIPERNGSLAETVRIALRHDPDLLFLDGIDTADDAATAVRAALQGGPLVVASLHALSTPEMLAQLRRLGITPGDLAPVLNGILFQRLAPRLCPHCRLPETEGELSPKHHRRNENGCDTCGGRGTAGRIGLFELTPIDTIARQTFARTGQMSEQEAAATRQRQNLPSLTDAL